jgi:hypothetical protein
MTDTARAAAGRLGTGRGAAPGAAKTPFQRET